MIILNSLVLMLLLLNMHLLKIQVCINYIKKNQLKHHIH